PPAGRCLLEVDRDTDDPVLDPGPDPNMLALRYRMLRRCPLERMNASWIRCTEAVRPPDPRLPQPTFWPSHIQWSLALEMSLCHRARPVQAPRSAGPTCWPWRSSG